MTDPRAQLRIAVGLAVSLAVHAIVFSPFLLALLALISSAGANAADDHRAPEPTDELRLGVDAPTPLSMTWIGYEEYEKHLAQRAEFDQAYFETEESAGAPAAPLAEVTPIETPTPDDARSTTSAETERASAEVNPKRAAQPMEMITPDENAPAESETTATAEENTRADRAAAAQTAAATAEADADRSPLAPRQATTGEIVSALSEQFASLAEAVQATIDAEETEASAAAPRAASAGGAAPTAAGVPAPQREKNSEKESPPTSTELSLADLKAGKPLASHGLDITVRRPEFTSLMLLTASPGNPLVIVRFARDGRPLEASIFQGSGDPRVDSTILSSLYRWRAAGKPLAELTNDDDTIDVEIRIVLNPRVKP